MAENYLKINPDTARQVRLVMSDVDGTLTPGDDYIIPSVSAAIRQLEEYGIAVGLVSGRTLPELESLALELNISGPIIAENGGVAKLNARSEPLDLGYSRQPALKTLERLREMFPHSIKEREDNKDRLVDIVFRSSGIPREELERHLMNTQLLDSGYILHLMQRGISKGKTLMRLLEQMEVRLSPKEILVFGDSATDRSLFELFPRSVLIHNPRLPTDEHKLLREFVSFVGEKPCGEGFAEVALHIIRAMGNGT